MSFTVQTNESCLNCSAPLAGKFCSSCGQKAIEPSERTIKHFLYQFFGSAFFLENNFLKNLWVLVSKPGSMVLDYMQGRRKRWMAPISLFLLINFFYFMLSPLSDFNLTLYDQQFQPYGAAAKPMISYKLEKSKLSFDGYAEVYAKKSSALANTLIILNVPVLSFFLMIIFRQRNYFFADHFIYSLHIFGFFLLFLLAQVVVMLIQLTSHRFFPTADAVIYPFTVGLRVVLAGYGIWYIVSSVRKVYNGRSWRLIFWSLLIMLAFLITHFIYRFILFLITLVVT